MSHEFQGPFRPLDKTGGTHFFQAQICFSEIFHTSGTDEHFQGPLGPLVVTF